MVCGLVFEMLFGNNGIYMVLKILIIINLNVLLGLYEFFIIKLIVCLIG